jgi:hypothetical protein
VDLASLDGSGSGDIGLAGPSMGSLEFFGFFFILLTEADKQNALDLL